MRLIFEESSSWIVIIELVGVLIWMLLRVCNISIRGNTAPGSAGLRISDVSQRPPEKRRRPYPKVQPKYRNPDDHFETWCGRGKQPRWVVTQLARGRRLEEFGIQPAAADVVAHRGEELLPMLNKSSLELLGS